MNADARVCVSWCDKGKKKTMGTLDSVDLGCQPRTSRGSPSCLGIDADNLLAARRSRFFLV